MHVLLHIFSKTCTTTSLELLCKHARIKAWLNIEADLHMEHLNWLCKSYIEALGANATDATVLHAGRCIGTVSLISDNFDLATGRDYSYYIPCTYVPIYFILQS